MMQLILQPDESSSVDTYLLNGPYAGINFGDTEVLTIGTASISKVTVYGRALLRFDLRTISSLATIESAVLTLRQGDGGSLLVPQTLSAYRVTRGDWTEFGATWNQYDGSHAWSIAGGDYTTTDHDECAVTSAGGDVAFGSLKMLVADALLNRDGFLNLLVVGPESGSANNFLTVRSASDPDPAKRPKLAIEYLPPEPALAVVDRGDGTGATAAVGGVDPTATASLLVATFAGDLGAPAWSVAGVRTGSGPLELNLPVGHYFGHVATTFGGQQSISKVVYFVVSAGLDSIHSRCLDGAQARLRLLGLPGLASERVLVEKLPTALTVSRAVDGLPAIVLSPHRAAMAMVAGTNGLDDVHYDVLVTMLERDNQEPTHTAHLDRHLSWREQIARAFRNQRLPGVEEVIDTVVEPIEGPDAENWKRQYLTSTLLLRFVSRERRGF
jgi:hypothetical protein